jgi:tetratricopeptide (TPR) repeat protein
MKSAARKKDLIDRLLERAAQLYRAGDRIAAVRLYEQAIAEAPRHAAAHNFLGLAYAQRGEIERAVPLLEKAVALDPNLPSCRYNLGTILQQLKRHDGARHHYELAIAAQPGDPQIHSNLGTVLRALGKVDQAVDHFRRAIELNPRFVAAHFNLGNALQELLRHEEAYAAFAAALELDPNFAEAHVNAAYALAAVKHHEEALVYFDRAIALKADYPKIHLDRGKVLFRLYRYAEAVASYERALASDPDLSEVYLEAAAALNRLERFEDAAACCRRILAQNPDDTSALTNLATALSGLRKYDEALALTQQVLAATPDLAPAHFTRAAVLEALDRGEEALKSYELALKYMPHDVFGQSNKGLCDLALGRLAEGWPLFENRWYGCLERPRLYPQPSWDGGPLTGPLLVWAEQGLGDQILFSSMINDLRARVPSLRVEVASRLVPLFARSFPDVEVIPMGKDLSNGPIASHVAFASLGRYIRPDWASFKHPPPAYLKADPARAAALRARLKSQGQCVIGLSWGSANAKVGKAKTAKLLDFESVLRIPGCRFVDLQYGNTQAERTVVFDELGVNVERLDDIDNLNDIDGLAALISACDLVVTVSNTTAHLAGALGKRTWVFLPFGRGLFWYWFRNREDSPWYPAVCLKRRMKDQSWPELVSLSAPEIAIAATQQRASG